MFAASAKDLLESWNQLGVQGHSVFAAGFLTAFIVALIAIKFFLRLINKIKLVPFADISFWTGYCFLDYLFI